MTLAHVSSLFNIDKCKIYPLTADPAGGSPTYGAGISVPGIRELNIGFDILNKELYGDAHVMATKTKVRKCTATANHAQINLDALAVFIGGAVTDTGVTPSQVAKWKLKGSSIPAPFKLEAQILAVDHVPTGGDAHMVLWKCTADAAGLGGVQEDFSIPTLTLSGTALYSTDDMLDIVLNETSTALG